MGLQRVAMSWWILLLMRVKLKNDWGGAGKYLEQNPELEGWFKFVGFDLWGQETIWRRGSYQPQVSHLGFHLICYVAIMSNFHFETSKEQFHIVQ